MTGGAKINFGGAREVYLCKFKRGTGAREIYPSLDQMNKVKTKNLKGFSGRKQVITKRKKRSSSQKCHEIRCHSTKIQTTIWASICTPVAPSLLISLRYSPRLGGHNFRLKGHNFRLGGHGPGMPPRGAGLPDTMHLTSPTWTKSLTIKL